MENKFNDKDKEKIVEFLNFVAQKAKFEMNTQEVIKYFGLLSYMQKDLLPKVDSNILEIKRVIEPKVEKEKVKK
jgi:hypothetical protein